MNVIPSNKSVWSRVYFQCILFLQVFPFSLEAYIYPVYGNKEAQFPEDTILVSFKDFWITVCVYIIVPPCPSTKLKKWNKQTTSQVCRSPGKTYTEQRNSHETSSMIYHFVSYMRICFSQTDRLTEWMNICTIGPQNKISSCYTIWSFSRTQCALEIPILHSWINLELCLWAKTIRKERDWCNLIYSKVYLNYVSTYLWP